MARKARILTCDDLLGNAEQIGDCLVWQRSRHPDGYGTVWMLNKVHYAHRLMWTLKFGPIPTGLFVCHRCDNPPCINLDHLFLGTNGDNMRDASRKGRTYRPYASGKLSKSDVREIARLKGSGESSLDLAAKFNVHKTTINDAVRRFHKIPFYGAGS